MITKTYFSIAIFLLSLGVYSQTNTGTYSLAGKGVSTTFATDYQAIDVNPSNLGWATRYEGKKFSFGTSDLGFSIHSKLFKNDNLKLYFDKGFPSLASAKGATYSRQELENFSKDLQYGYRFEFQTRLLGLAFQHDKIGGIAFGINENIYSNMQYSSDIADIITQGFAAPYFDSLLMNDGRIIYNDPNLSTDTLKKAVLGKSNDPKTLAELSNGTSISLSWVREFNVSYGRKIIGFSDENFILYGGVGIRFLQGIGLFNAVSTEEGFTSYGAMSNSFNLNPTDSGIVQAGPFKFALPKPAGTGYAIDLGANIVIAKKLKIGVAATNIGSITWKNNTFSLSGDSLINNVKLGGFDNAYDNQNVDSTSNLNVYQNFISEYAKFKNENKSVTIAQPARLRLGAGIQIGKVLEVGADIVAPLNSKPGNFKNALFNIGGEINLGVVVISSGFATGGVWGNRVPFGIRFGGESGTYEAGIATQDLISVFTLLKNESPTASFSVGSLRFRF